MPRRFQHVEMGKYVTKNDDAVREIAKSCSLVRRISAILSIATINSIQCSFLRRCYASPVYNRDVCECSSTVAKATPTASLRKNTSKRSTLEFCLSYFSRETFTKVVL